MLAIGAGVAVAGEVALGNDQEAFLNDAAKRLDVTPGGAEGCAAGRLRRPHRRGRRGRQDHQGAGRGDEAALGAGRPAALRRRRIAPRLRPPRRPASLAAAATYLGLDRGRAPHAARVGQDARRDREGKGKSVDGLKKALTAEAKTKLDAAVKAGKLTQAQADELQARMTEHLDDLVNGTGGPARHRRPRRGFGMGGPPPGGMQPSAFAPAGSPA